MCIIMMVDLKIINLSLCRIIAIFKFFVIVSQVSIWFILKATMQHDSFQKHPWIYLTFMLFMEVSISESDTILWVKRRILTPCVCGGMLKLGNLPNVQHSMTLRLSRMSHVRPRQDFQNTSLQLSYSCGNDIKGSHK